MKVCNMQAMKMIKELEARKAALLANEDRRCTYSYKEGENKVLPDYDYEATRTEVRSIDGRIRAIRSALARANTEVQVEGFGITVGEALVYLAQMQGERAQLESLTEAQQVTRRITANGVLEYTECAYDVKKASADLESLRMRIGELQVAIDRANLLNTIEV